MNKIETLPKMVEYDGRDWSLALWVNAFGNFCIGYRYFANFESILCHCVEPKKEPYLPPHFDHNKTFGLNVSIGNQKTLDDCIDVIHEQLSKFEDEIKKG